MDLMIIGVIVDLNGCGRMRGAAKEFSALLARHFGLIDLACVDSVWNMAV